MKKGTQILAQCCIILGVWTPPSTQGQISLSSMDLPQAGVMYPITNTTAIGLDLMDVTGADVLWDASSLISIGDAPITPSPMSDASITAAITFGPFNPQYQCDFFLPTALPDLGIDLGIPIDGFNNFYQTAGSHYTIAGIGLSASGLDLPIAYEDIDEFFPLPFTYGQSFASSAAFSLDIPETFAYTMVQERDVEADGWGTLILPDGNHEALRIRTTISAVDSIYIAQLGQGFSIPRNQVIYQWWGMAHGFPLLEITTTAGVPLFTTYQAFDAENSIESLPESECSIFPNPVAQGQPAFIAGIHMTKHWNIFDIQGRSVGSGTGPSTVTTRHMNPGVYFIKLEEATRRLVVIE